MDVNNLLPKGEITVDAMNGVKHDARLKELHSKYRRGAREHYDWYVEYIKRYEVGQPIPYHENFGMTPEEFQERQERMENTRYYSTGTYHLQVLKSDGIIQFKADKKLKVFNNVSFNLKNNTVNVGDYVLQFAESIDVPHANNVFRSKWKGYLWKYESPNDIHLDALTNINGLNVVQYKVIIGQLEDGRGLLELKATEVTAGVVVIDLDLPLII